MRTPRTSFGRWIVGAMSLSLGLLMAGCSQDSSTQPEPEVKAMGGIQITRDQAPGTPYQAGVVVTVDGQIVTDAAVRVNGVDLTYMSLPAQPEASGYVGMVMASAGDRLTLSVTAAGKTITLGATVPGMVEIQSPTPGGVFADGAAIPVSWTASSGATLTVVTCAGATSTTPAMWLLGAEASAHTVPAEATTAPGCRIMVMGVNGSGDLPSSMDLRTWVGKNGFWVSCQDHVDVVIAG